MIDLMNYSNILRVMNDAIDDRERNMEVKQDRESIITTHYSFLRTWYGL